MINKKSNEPDIRVKVYMASHLKGIKPPFDYITPIHVGAALSDNLYYDITDHHGDHISDKNGSYCELTALYWMWKNDSSDFKGLCHYRRFFDISYDDILSVLESGKIILPKISNLGRSLENQFKRNHNDEIWEMMIQILFEKYPEIEKQARKIISGNLMYPFNMFIGNKEFVDHYCNWLFPILFELEARLPDSLIDTFNKRYAGYLSERLLVVFIKIYCINVYECDLVDGKGRRVSQSVFRSIRNNLWYRFLE